MNLPIYMQNKEFNHVKWIVYLTPEDEIEYLLVNEKTNEGKRTIITKDKLTEILDEMKNDWEECKLPDINLIADGNVVNTIDMNTNKYSF